MPRHAVPRRVVQAAIPLARPSVAQLETINAADVEGQMVRVVGWLIGHVVFNYALRLSFVVGRPGRLPPPSS